MEYRKGFVLCSKDNYGIVNVTNDGWHVCYFISNKETQEEFNKECEVFLDSVKFRDSLRKQRGY